MSPGQILFIAFIITILVAGVGKLVAKVLPKKIEGFTFQELDNDERSN